MKAQISIGATIRFIERIALVDVMSTVYFPLLGSLAETYLFFVLQNSISSLHYFTDNYVLQFAFCNTFNITLAVRRE